MQRKTFDIRKPEKQDSLNTLHAFLVIRNKVQRSFGPQSLRKNFSGNAKLNSYDTSILSHSETGLLGKEPVTKA